MNPRIVNAEPLQGYKLFLKFTNGEKGIYDCSPLLNFGVFRELRDMSYFNKVKVVDGTIAWPNDQDICPDTLYIDAAKTANKGASPDRKDSGG
jgi:hypothetical protein